MTSCLKSLLYSKYCGGTLAATPDTFEGFGVDDEGGGEEGVDSSLLARESERKRAACWDMRSVSGSWLAAAIAADCANIREVMEGVRDGSEGGLMALLEVELGRLVVFTVRLPGWPTGGLSDSTLSHSPLTRFMTLEEC